MNLSRRPCALASALALSCACAGRLPTSERPHLAIVTAVSFAKGSELAEDVTEWLRAPTLAALLGDL